MQRIGESLFRNWAFLWVNTHERMPFGILQMFKNFFSISVQLTLTVGTARISVKIGSDIRTIC